MGPACECDRTAGTRKRSEIQDAQGAQAERRRTRSNPDAVELDAHGRRGRPDAAEGEHRVCRGRRQSLPLDRSQPDRAQLLRVQGASRGRQTPALRHPVADEQYAVRGAFRGAMPRTTYRRGAHRNSRLQQIRRRGTAKNRRARLTRAAREATTMPTLKVLLDHLAFPEGPRWHDNRLFFSDMHAHKVMTVDLDGKTQTVAEVPNRPSGLGWLPDGRMLVVSMTDRKLMRLEGGSLKLHADLSKLASFDCNDMVVDAKGRAYVGNFGYDLHINAPQKPAELVMVTPDGKASVVAKDLQFPNGTVITPDGKTLIVGES